MNRIFFSLLFFLTGTLWAGLLTPLPAFENNVRDHGAVGDGKTDDTAAVQRAVDAGRGVISFTRGVYRLGKTVQIDLDRVGYTSLTGDGAARIVMAGPGPAFRFVGTHEGTASPTTVKPNVWERQRMPMVDRLEIIGAHEKAVGLEATGTMQLTISRMNIRECLHGIHLTRRNRNVLISNCHIYKNRGVGIFLDNQNLHQINVSNCHISYNGGGGIVLRGGVIRNLHIGNCDIEANMAPDGPPTANVLIENAGGSQAEIAITGCTIQHTHDAPGSANIRIIGALTSVRGGKEIHQNDGNITITGNVLSDVQINLHIREARGITITGNTMWKGYAHNVLVENCTNIVLASNVHDRNPRYGYGDGNDAHLGVVFRDSADCTITGEHIQGARTETAGLVLERCRRFNITGCTILDCEPAGVLLAEVSHSRLSDCLIRNDNEDSRSISLKVLGGEGNMILHNLLDGKEQIETRKGVVEGNHDGN